MSASPVDAQPDASLACPACQSLLAARATLCAACGSALTVELSVAPIADAKRAYQTARRIAEFGGAAAATAAWAKTLQSGTLRVASPRGWDETARFVSALAAEGVQAAVRLTAPPRRAAGAMPPPRLIVAALAAAAFIGGAAWFTRDPETAAETPQAAAVAAPQDLSVLPPPDALAPARVAVPAQRASAPGVFAPRASLDFNAIRRSIVLITTAEGSQGSGFVVAPGVILTNKHVIGERTAGSVVDVTFVAGGQTQKVSARLARVGKRLDLAVVQCGGECETLPALGLGRLAATPLGTTVYALGNPFGLTLTLSKGIVSSKERNLNGLLFVQSDVSVNPGNSGGPLFNEQGEVLGVVTAKATYGEGITFVLPVEYALQGGDPVLEGFVAVDGDFSADMLALMEQAGVEPGAEGQYAAQAEGPPTEELQLTAAAGAENAYGVRFLLRLGPRSQANADGPFYLVVEQANGFRGVFPMPNMAAPRKVGESQQAGAVYFFEYRGVLANGPRLGAGDKLAVRFGDDRVSNRLILQ